jgi:hypothetical protein
MLLLLLALGMRIFAMLVGGLRVLLCTRCMFLALCMVALAVMFCGGPMRLCSVFVMFRCLIMFVLLPL